MGYEESWQAFLADGDNNLNQQKLFEAEGCYRQALKKVHHSPHTSDDVVKCLEKLAADLALENKTEEAVSYYHKSLGTLERSYGKNSSKLVPTLFALGSIFEAEGDPKIAMKFYRRALAINEQHYGPLSPAVADSLHHLGHATFAAGQPEQAESHYKSSLAILMKQPSLSSSAQLESLLNDYNDLLKKTDNSDKNLISDFQNQVLKDRRGFPVPTTAVPPSTWQKQTKALSNGTDDQQNKEEQKILLRDFQQPLTSPRLKVPPSAWQKQINVLSDRTSDQQNNEEQQILLRGFKQPFSNSTLAPAYKTMTDDLYSQHSYKQGEDYYERMIAIDIKTVGPYHPAVADDLTGLALLCISEHRYAEAKPLLLRALSIYESVYGSDNLLVTRTRSSLAFVLNKLGETQESLSLYDQAFKRGRIFVDPNNLQTARMLNELGFLYYSQGKLEDARTVYQWALASTKGAVGERNILVAACLTDYANVLNSLGLTAKANEMQEEVREIEVSHAGSTNMED